MDLIVDKEAGNRETCLFSWMGAIKADSQTNEKDNSQIVTKRESAGLDTNPGHHRQQ